MQREYKICSASRITDLEESVNRMLTQGWKVKGGLKIHKQTWVVEDSEGEIKSSEEVLYMQTIIKKN